MAVQRGRDLLIKIDMNGEGLFETVAGLRATRLSFNAESVDVTSLESLGGWRELLAGAGVRSATISGAGVFRDATSDERVRQLFFAGDIPAFQVIIPDFGTATPGDFTRAGGAVNYHEPAEWSYRRMVLHYAHLCAAAGGVDAFMIGSELRGLTFARDDAGFPAVDQLCALAADVRAILPEAKLTYGADWSEYAGMQPEGTADRIFHLDPLWAHPAIDAVGIDNYLPLSDWREGVDHLDAHRGDIHDLDYLTENVAGGEYHDWYYPSDEARAAQIRTKIEDRLHGEHWIWRQKDLKGWWENAHHDRIGGIRSALPTAWEPRSKPIWFTELGCPAVDKGTNQPNVFLDAKSSESALPHASNGQRDDLILIQYLRAVHRHFADPANNPQSDKYDGPMVDMDHAHVWAWDARPYPHFPARADLWADGANHRRGHWLNGRATLRTLASVVRDICASAGVTAVETSGLHGVVRGYQAEDTDSARAMLQPLMLAFSFDAVERDGILRFANRTGRVTAVIEEARLVPDDGPPVFIREAEPEVAGRVRLLHLEEGGDHASAAAEAVLADEDTTTVAGREIPLMLTRAEARQITGRWLVETRVARDAAMFTLPPSQAALGPGDVVQIAGTSARWRIDRIEDGLARRVEALRIEPEAYLPSDHDDDNMPMVTQASAVPVEALFMDLPRLPDAAQEHTPRVALAALPWPGRVALWSGAGGVTEPELIAPRATVIGVTETPLFAARPGRRDHGPALRVRLLSGEVASVTHERLLAGANLAAIGDESPDRWELFQFQGAELVAPRIWDLRQRLRGQAGTDGIMPVDWPTGSRFVLIDHAVHELALPRAHLGVARDYRWGPASRSPDDPTWSEREIAFKGAGLRPYAPAHLRARIEAGGTRLSWIRRSRIDGDLWTGPGIPLGEAEERYLLRITVDGVLRREVMRDSPEFLYTTTMQADDGATGTRIVQVAQISAIWGPGPFTVMTLP